MRKDFLIFGSPAIDESDINEVVATLRSGWIGTGPRVARFEDLFREYIGADHAVAVSSCTAALHLSMIVAGLEAGDEVITTPMTFCATANAILHTGAHPVFVDVELSTGNIDPERIEAAITSRTRAILPVHYTGRPCRMVAPVGLYGMTEVGYIAWQCERREGFHVNAETCLVEVVRDGRRVDPGKLGAIEGRAREALRLPDGRILTRRWIVDQLNGFPRLGEYRLHQETPSRFRLALALRGTNDSVGAANQGSTREHEETVVRRLCDVLGSVEITVEPDHLRVSGKSVKTNPISSDLPPPIAAGRESARTRGHSFPS